MIPIFKATTIQIDVTNACPNMCANCTRFVGHHKKPFFMDLETVERALKSVENAPNRIGLMGGEPTMHPQFAEICELYRKIIPDKRRRGFWTSGYKWKEYERDIRKTFDTDRIVYNPHEDKDEGWHQPLLVSSDEIIEDKELMWKLIDNCWIQRRWSPTITPKGCFFCEVAGAFDMLFDDEGGYPIEKGWWKKTPEQFQDQVKHYCVMCSAAIPLEIPSNHEKFDIISPSNLKRLKAAGSPKVLQGNYKLYDKKYTFGDYKRYVKNWAPGHFRDFIQHEPGKKEFEGKESPCDRCGACK
jgi:hypothetical protein